MRRCSGIGQAHPDSNPGFSGAIPEIGKEAVVNTFVLE